MLQSMDKPCIGLMHRCPPSTTLNAKDSTQFSVENTLINGQKVEQLNRPGSGDKAHSAKSNNNETLANSGEDSLKGGPVAIPAGYYTQQ